MTEEFAVDLDSYFFLNRETPKNYDQLKEGQTMTHICFFFLTEYVAFPPIVVANVKGTLPTLCHVSYILLSKRHYITESLTQDLQNESISSFHTHLQA